MTFTKLVRRVPLRAALITLAALTVLCALPANAAWPDKPVRLIVPFPAGGPSDSVARAISQKLQVSLGQPVLVEYKPGAGTNIAAEFVAKSSADGNTLFLMMVATQAINEAIYPKLAYNTLRDFDPITTVTTTPLVLVAHPSLPAENISELIALAKRRPGTINFGSSGAGTPLHLGGELLNTLAGIKLTHIPYKGGAAALNDLLGGQIQLALSGTSVALPFVQSGRLKALGVASLSRIAIAPSIPAISETLPGYDVEVTLAVVTAKGTSPEILARLNTEISKALQDPDTRDRLRTQGFEVKTGTPEELTKFIRKEIARWGPIVRETGVKAE
jgi:tripartite-type tricarboxylate transporter receptor subunit TctC